MKKITILIPKIKPPDVSDIITTQIENILSKLNDTFTLNVVWLIFQPDSFSDYRYNDYHVIDYHNFDNAVDAIDKIKPDLIINEVRLGINGICFGIASKFRKIPNITITPTGKSELFSTTFSTKSNLHLIFSDKVLADVTLNQPKKFAMLRYSLHRYFFILKTLRKSNYGIIALLKFISFYPRFQILSKTYPALHKITSGNLNLCFNEHWFKRLLDEGFDKSTLELVGDPAFDNLYEKIQNNTIGKSDSKIKILFCPTPMHEHGWLTKKDEDGLIIKLIKKILTLENVEISLKIHPSSASFEEYDKLLKSQNIEIPLLQKEDTITLLQQSDVMITYGSSNVILDAILLKKPIILFKNSAIPNLSRLSDESVITECTNLDELDKLIKNSITSPVSNDIFEQYIHKQIGIFDGKNSERIAKHIQELLQIKNN